MTQYGLSPQESAAMDAEAQRLVNMVLKFKPVSRNYNT
jgi:hypothetical protein